MPRSSRHKSHKHSLKEAREYSDSEIEDVKDSGSRSILDRVLKDSGDLRSGEKRKVSSQVKEGKDLSGHRNGVVLEEYVSSKMRKEEKARDESNRGDRRGAVDREKKGESLKCDGEKGSKSSQVKGDVKSRSSKRYESGGDLKEENGVSLDEKEYNRTGSRTEKRESEKEKGGKDIKEVREKERGFEKEKKNAESRLSNEVIVDGDIVRKQEMQSDVLVEDRHGKRRRHSAEPNAEIDEQRARKKKESYGDLDKYQDDIRDGGKARRLSSRSERLKEGRSFDEKKKERNYGEKSCEDVDKDVKYHDDLDRDSKHWDAKYRDDGDRDSRHRDDKYRDGSDRDGRRREDKYRENSGRDAKHIDDKNQGEVERDSRRQDDKYREDGGRDNRRKDVKHMEVDKESRHGDTRYYNEADRDGRHKVERLREDTDRDIRQKEDKYLDDYERENRHRDKLGVDDDREKRFREVKYRDDRSLKDRSGDKSESKRSRDENHASGFHSRKPSFYDDGDDRMSSYKDDHAEKHSSGHGRGDMANERGRSTSKIADMDLSVAHYRRQSSPSPGSQIMSNQYRLPKQDEPKYKDYSVTPKREHENKHLQKDDSNSGEFSAQRRLKPDIRASPMPLMDKSPSSMSERKNSRTDARRNLDVDESGPRYGGLKDGKDFFGREARGSCDVAMEKFPVDEFSEVGDNGSVVSPLPKCDPLPNSAKSLLAPPPFKTGADSSLPFGTSDDDSRGKSSNRHRRHGDASMGRMQGNSWRGAPNWPSPVPNGFIPFQHGPPPVGFHHMMQHFPVPHLFGVRPSMDLNHGRLPYPIPDPDRFSGHVRPMGWRDDDSCPPPLHGWEANNSTLSEDSHLLGRPDWAGTRNHSGMWTNSASIEMSVSEKQNILLQGVAGEYIAGQFSQQSEQVKSQHGIQAHSSEAVQRETSEPSLKFKEIPTAEGEPQKDNGNMCHAYLSRLDISADLAGQELYAQCANLHGVDHNLLFDGDEPKILYLEEDVDGKLASNKMPSTFLFTTTDDCVFQKAMILYNKLKEKVKIVEPDSLAPDLKTTRSLPNQSGEITSRKDVVDEKMVEMEMAGGEQEQIDLLNISQVEESGILNVEAASFPASQNRDADDLVDKSDSCVYATSNTSMEVQVSSDIEARDINDSVMEENLGLETADSPAYAVKSEMTMSSDVTMERDVPISSFNGERGMDVKCGGSLIADVPKACEAVMPEPTESGLVNLSRRHHSPESTH